MKTVTYILPEHWLPALVNDDLTGLDTEESISFQNFMHDHIKYHGTFWCLGPVDDEGNGFMRYHDARDYDIGPCDTVTVAFHVERNNMMDSQFIARDAAHDHVSLIMGLMRRLADSQESLDTIEDFDNLYDEIQEYPLSVLVRSNWHIPGQTSELAEYEILLSTGRPAVRIIGELSDGEPVSARIEYQNWGIPWTDYPLFSEQEDAIVQFASHFYYTHL